VSPQVRRGLQHAKNHLRASCMDIAKKYAHADMLAAAKWIAQQERIDENRRKSRGKYRRSRT
jgi:hypothetical protein